MYIIVVPDFSFSCTDIVWPGGRMSFKRMQSLYINCPQHPIEQYASVSFLTRIQWPCMCLQDPLSYKKMTLGWNVKQHCSKWPHALPMTAPQRGNCFVFHYEVGTRNFQEESKLSQQFWAHTSTWVIMFHQTIFRHIKYIKRKKHLTCDYDAENVPKKG